MTIQIIHPYQPNYTYPLTPRENKLLCLHFGIPTPPTYSLRQLSQLFQLSPERIRQTIITATKKLKHYNHPEIIFREEGGVFRGGDANPLAPLPPGPSPQSNQ